MERFETERFERATSRLFRSNMRITRVVSIMPPIMELVGGFGLAAAIWYGSRTIAAGEMTTGEFTSFMAALFMMYSPAGAADVPWTMYYDGNYAIHTSYWHDGFGGPRSHGCVNLAPRDAKLLFRWSSPDVPAGWIAVYGDEDNPGSMVRVRSRRTPEPEFRGYARTLHDRGVMISSVTPSE